MRDHYQPLLVPGGWLYWSSFVSLWWERNYKDPPSPIAWHVFLFVNSHSTAGSSMKQLQQAAIAGGGAEAAGAGAPPSTAAPATPPLAPLPPPRHQRLQAQHRVTIANHPILMFLTLLAECSLQLLFFLIERQTMTCFKFIMSLELFLNWILTIYVY